MPRSVSNLNLANLPLIVTFHKMDFQLISQKLLGYLLPSVQYLSRGLKIRVALPSSNSACSRGLVFKTMRPSDICRRKIHLFQERHIGSSVSSRDIEWIHKLRTSLESKQIKISVFRCWHLVLVHIFPLIQVLVFYNRFRRIAFKKPLSRRGYASVVENERC